FGPFIWMYWLAKSHRAAPAITVGLFWLVCVGIIACEVRRKAITAVSLFIFLVWLVVLAFVFSFHFGSFISALRNCYFSKQRPRFIDHNTLIYSSLRSALSQTCALYITVIS